MLAKNIVKLRGVAANEAVKQSFYAWQKRYCAFRKLFFS